MLLYEALRGGFVMKNLKFYKTKITNFVLAGTMLATSALGFSACGTKKSEKFDTVGDNIRLLNEDATIRTESKTSENTTSTELNIAEDTTSEIVTIEGDVNSKINSMIPNMSDEILKDSSIILLLDRIASRDENGKINVELVSELKSKIDADNMVSNYNSFLDTIQQTMIEQNKVLKVSNILPNDLASDKLILSKIEEILSNLINYSTNNNKEQTLAEFDKIYSLFIEGSELDINGNKFKISDLGYSSRAVANTYAEVASYYSRNYITEEQYGKMDRSLDDQNNKAYIRTTLEVLSNQMVEKSEIDVVKAFDAKYEEITKLLNNKVNLTSDTVKNLVNYINIKYLNSDKVSIKDKNTILGEYSDEKVSDVLLAIDAINEYNLNNQNSIIPFSVLLVNEHLKTDTGITDKTALDFVQYNSIQLVNTKDYAITINNPRSNPYFENDYKYFTKQNLVHVVSENNREVEKHIVWQNISDGTNLINNEVILYTLNKLPENTPNLDNYIEKAQMNLIESIKSNQKIIDGECQITDVKQFIKKN